MNLRDYYPNEPAPARRAQTKSGAPFNAWSMLADPRLRIAVVSNCAANGNMSIVMVLTSLVLAHHGHSLQSIAADLVRRQEGEGGESRANLMNQLSAREQNIVHLLAEHHRPRSVATELGISYHTVRNHLRRIFRKLNVSSQSELLRIFKDR